MHALVVMLLLVVAAFALEEFVLIRPVLSLERSDPLSRRLETAAIWVPAAGMALTGATMRAWGGVRLGGLVNVLGLLSCLCGIGLRWWARATLGHLFTIGVVRQERHEVVESGPYRLLRHPAYLALMLFYVGVPLLAGSAFGLLVLGVPAVAIFVTLAAVEDRKLAELLGADYRAYRRRSWRLVPGLW
ncbi:MAG TPA: isoprenylcysteine carboxylmethyltransferase family protein [Candidatus Polarisedimenticolaceae bacterium]|nr:isoprenylcysteine carboxylmethyltransferase family protein [Candidatus Polarisedimenticolaceae bacterium]